MYLNKFLNMHKLFSYNWYKSDKVSNQWFVTLKIWSSGKRICLKSVGFGFKFRLWMEINVKTEKNSFGLVWWYWLRFKSMLLLGLIFSNTNLGWLIEFFKEEKKSVKSVFDIVGFSSCESRIRNPFFLFPLRLL